MAKLKVGRNASGKKPKKKVVLDEITLGSSSEDESSGDNNDVMEVDESHDDDKENGKVEMESLNGEKQSDKAESEHEMADTEHKKDVTEPQKGECETEKGENGTVTAENEPSCEGNGLVNMDTSTNHVKNEGAESIGGDAATIVNGVTPPGDNAPVVQPMVAEPPKPLVSPRPGFILSANEVKSLHLVPRVALVPLKHDKKYHLSLNEKRSAEEQQDDLEVTKLLDLVQADYSNVMQLGNGISAIIQANGDSLVLPPDYKEKIEARKKRVLRWTEESTWVPSKISVDKKLYVGNVKFGPTLSKTRLVLPKINPESEIKRVRQAERSKRSNAQRRAAILLQRQQELNAQRTNGVQQKGTPIVKNGKVVGYAIQFANTTNLPSDAFVKVPASKLSPSRVVFPSNAGDADFPELEDYSILEPEIILKESNQVLILKDVSAPVPPPGSRQVIINGKLLTLVPFKQNEIVQTSPPANAASTVVKYQQLLPKGLTLVKDNDLLDEATCQLCSVKLPRSILDMHIKMRHQNVNKNNNGAALDEIEIVDDDDEEEQKAAPKGKKPMPALVELNPESIDHDDVVTVDVDPLSILP